MAEKFWTTERLERLAALRSSGVSSTIAARAFGVSRNAVIGIALRRWGGWGQRPNVVRARRGPRLPAPPKVAPVPDGYREKVRIADLARLRDQGATMAEAGEALGISADDVRQIARREWGRWGPVRAKRKRKAGPQRVLDPAAPEKGTPWVGVVVEPVSRAALAGRPALLEVRRDQCVWPLWPIGRPPEECDAIVCGDEVIEGRPYCEAHERASTSRRRKVTRNG